MVQIRQLTVQDPAFEAWHAGIRLAHQTGRESSWWESLESTRVYLARKSTRFARMAIGAFDGPTCVGGAELALPLQHDTDTMSVELGVPLEHRGRGVGTSLAAYVGTIAAQRDRTVLQAELHVPAGMALGDTDGGRFALARGMRSVSTEDRFLLELPVDGARVAELRVVDDGYRITSFVDRSHRGHRLGARLKLANLDNLAALSARTCADRRWVQTYTEQHNTAMQRTNEAFGFRRVDVLHELEGATPPAERLT